MAISRTKKKEFAPKAMINTKSDRTSSESLSSIPPSTEWYPSKHYQKCSMIVWNRNANCGQPWQGPMQHFLMEGNKRFTTTGRYNTHSIFGAANQTTKNVEPQLVAINPPLAKNEIFVDATTSHFGLVATTSAGNVYSGGWNVGHGQLGHNDLIEKYSLTKITTSAGGVTFGPTGVKAVKVFGTGMSSTSYVTMYVVDATGKVYAAGHNGNGECGDATTTQRSAYVRSGSLENIVDMFTGAQHAFALRKDGTLFAWGYNITGNLGLGDTTVRTSPTITNTNVKKVVCADLAANSRSYLLKTDGTVWFTGNGITGSTGLGDSTQRTSWTQITTNLSGKNVVDIVCNGTNNQGSAWALIDDGSIYSWGYNGYGQLGNGNITNQSTPTLLVQPTNFPKVNKIFSFGQANEYGFSGVNMESGRIFSCGNFCEGTLGVALDAASGNWPIESETANRAHYGVREVESPPPLRDGYVKLVDIQQRISDNNHTASVFALLSDGSVWGRGDNSDGQLGFFTATNYSGALGATTVGWNSQGTSSWKRVDF